jgi:uncharacterized protein
MKHGILQEIEIWYIIPSIRREFAVIMSKKKLSQKEISKKLGITEPAVSQYIKQKRAVGLKFDAKTKKEMEKAVDRILKGSHSITETQKICKLLRENMTVCKLHRSRNSNLPKNCKLCMV